VAFRGLKNLEIDAKNTSPKVLVSEEFDEVTGRNHVERKEKGAEAGGES